MFAHTNPIWPFTKKKYKKVVVLLLGVGNESEEGVFFFFFCGVGEGEVGHRQGGIEAMAKEALGAEGGVRRSPFAVCYRSAGALPGCNATQPLRR